MDNSKQINICDELSNNFIDFSYEANSCRAFADARDGLKPGQRACLWEMYHKGYLSSKPTVKGAKVAGAVSGNWWPHGDVAIYETFTRMSQSWINNIPEVDWKGNNGSQIIPDSAASSRYTETRLSKATEEGMFHAIKKRVVKMIPNYSEDDEWPEVLPAIFPRLMVNGCQGIGSTIANVWLPHNLTDIGNVILSYIETNAVDFTGLAPDFPTGCQIINKNDLAPIYATGKGKVTLRARADIVKDHIYFRELPYQVYVEPLIEKIKELASKGEITGIDAVYNRSSKKGIEVDVECSENPDAVLKQLYSKTDLQKSYSANQWALVGKTPKLLTLKDYCEIYVDHNLLCIQNEAQFDLDKAQDRLHIVEGLLRALEDIDNIIALIKKSASAAAAKDALIATYKFSEAQAKAIVDMKLGKLAGLEKVELNQEADELRKEVEELNTLFLNETKQREVLRERLTAFVKKYGDARRTGLEQIELPKAEKELETVVPEDCVVIATQNGDIKRVPAASFKTQKRNGKGVKTTDDAILDMISTNTVDTLMFFTDKGKMYRLLVDKVPTGTNASKGGRIGALINLEADEKVIAMTSLYRKSQAEYVIFITKQGLFKKTKLEEYLQTKRTTGIAAIKFKEGDSLATVTFANEEDFIVITKQGMSIRFETKEIAPIGRVTSGVKSIKLNEGDEVLIGLPIKHKTDTLATFSANGMGRKTSLEEFPVQGRGGKGLKIGSGDLSGATLISDEDNLLIVGSPNSICISATEIPLLARTAQGNIMIKNSTIKSVIKL